MYLLDTDILSNLMKRSPSSVLVEKLTRVPPDQQFTSSITLGELVYGARRLRERTDVLMAKIEDLLLPNLPVLAFDAAAARQYGGIRAGAAGHLHRRRRHAHSGDSPLARSEGSDSQRAPLPAGPWAGDGELARGVDNHSSPKTGREPGSSSILGLAREDFAEHFVDTLDTQA